MALVGTATNEQQKEDDGTRRGGIFDVVVAIHCWLFMAWWVVLFAEACLVGTCYNILHAPAHGKTDVAPVSCSLGEEDTLDPTKITTTTVARVFFRT